MDSFQVAEEFLRPYADRFYECVERGIDAYNEYPRLRATLSRRSHSSIRNDLIWDELEREFEEENGFSFDQHQNRRLMNIAESYSIRVKKLGAQMRPLNQLTLTVLKFVGEIPEDRFPGLDLPVNLDLGYRLAGITESKLEVYIRCPQGLYHHAWLWHLESPAAQSTSEELELTQMEIAEPRVKVREEEAAIKDEGILNESSGE